MKTTIFKYLKKTDYLMIFTDLQKVFSDDDEKVIEHLRTRAVPYHAEVKKSYGGEASRFTNSMWAKLILNIPELKKECEYFIEGEALNKLRQELGVSSTQDIVGREFTIYSQRLWGAQEDTFILDPERLESICAIQVFNDFSMDAVQKI